MTYKELLDNARKNVGPYCKACPVCNGRACGNAIPGPGSKGMGDTAIRNFDAWQRVRINMDTLNANVTPDTSFEFFGHTMKYPILAGPVGAVKMHYGQDLTDTEYNDIMVDACSKAGILAMTGDGVDPVMMQEACKTIKAHEGMGVPTVKPWDINTLNDKFELVRGSDAIAVAMDVDAAGLPFLQNLTPPAGSKSVEELKEVVKAAGKPFIAKGIMTVKGALKALEAGASGIVVSNHGGRVLDQCPSTAEVLPEIAEAVGDKLMDVDAAGLPFLQNLTPPAGSKSVEELKEVVKAAGKPFIAKGIMTVKGALKALEAGASGIVVSNHGGRVLDQCPSTAEVLPEIAEAVGDKLMILVDGGIRSGVDIYKAIAMGADAVIIARPYVTAMYGGRAEGIKLLTDKLGAELADTMRMCGTPRLECIGRDNIVIPKNGLF